MELRDWMKKNRWTLTAFSKEVGMTKNYVHMLIKGLRSPGLQTIRKIYIFTEGQVNFLEQLAPELLQQCQKKTDDKQQKQT